MTAPLLHAGLAAHVVELRERISRDAGVDGSRVQHDPLIGQERRVRREDAVLGAQRHQLVDQLSVLAVHIDLVDEITEPAHGPEPLDEIVTAAAAGAGKLGREFQASPLAGHLARHADRGAARLAVAACPDDLPAFEQVGKIARIGAVDVDPG